MKEKYKIIPQDEIDKIFKYIREKKEKEINVEYTEFGVNLNIVQPELTEFERAAVYCALVLLEKLKEELKEIK